MMNEVVAISEQRDPLVTLGLHTITMSNTMEFVFHQGLVVELSWLTKVMENPESNW